MGLYIAYGSVGRKSFSLMGEAPVVVLGDEVPKFSSSLPVWT